MYKLSYLYINSILLDGLAKLFYSMLVINLVLLHDDNLGLVVDVWFLFSFWPNLALYLSLPLLLHPCNHILVRSRCERKAVIIPFPFHASLELIKHYNLHIINNEIVYLYSCYPWVRDSIMYLWLLR